MYVFNATSGATVNFTKDSMTFLQTSGLNTSIGSSTNGLNKFVGFLREFRIWNIGRSLSTISFFRYNSISSTASNLLYYFRMNSAGELYSVSDSLSGAQFLEKSVNTPSVSWVAERNLVVCLPGTFYDGQCCTPVNLTGADVSFGYSSSGQFIRVLITGSTLAPSLLSSLLANITVVSIGNGGDASVLSSIQNAFTVNGTTGFMRSTSLVNPVAYNITIQAVVYSLFSSTSVRI